MDNRVLTPFAERVKRIQPDPLQPTLILDSLLALHFIAGICHTANGIVRGKCSEPGVRGAVSLSEPIRGPGDTALVSVLYYTVDSPVDTVGVHMPFAAEEEYRLLRRGTVWIVVAKRGTMIT